MWLPDTNTWIALMNACPSAAKSRLQSQSSEDIFLCDVVKAELYYGVYRSARRDKNMEVLEQLFSAFTSLSFDGAAARVCGRIRAGLAAVGTQIGPYDLQIASIALVRDLIVVTHNTREFYRVPGLKVEDWEA